MSLHLKKKKKKKMAPFAVAISIQEMYNLLVWKIALEKKAIYFYISHF